MTKISKAQRIRNYLSEHPDASVKEIMRVSKASAPQVYAVRNENKRLAAKEVVEEPKKWVVTHISTSDDLVDDPVNNPAHYKTGGIETIDFIEAKELNYHLGNVVKYIARADHKGDRLENLEKAKWYLQREINNLTGV